MHGEQRPAVRVDRIECARLDQRFDQSPVQRGQRHAADEVHEVHVFATARLAFRDDVLDRILADVADSPEPESDDVADCGVLVDRLVDIRGEHLDAHSPSLAQIQGGLVLVGRRALQQRGHELDRVVRLEVCGPVGDQAVRGGVRLVERIAGERDQDLPDRLCGLLGIAMLLHAGEKRHLLLGQHLGLLLAHGSPEHVCLAQRIAGQDTRG